MRRSLRISNYITDQACTIAPSDSIDRAINLMEERGIQHLIAAVDGRPVGVISDRDILISTGWMLSVERNETKWNSHATNMSPKRVEQIMSRPVHVIDVSDDVREAAKLMTDRKVSAAPVVAAERIVGIITDTDLLGWLEDLAVNGSATAKFLAAEVRTLMSVPVITVEPKGSLDEIVDIFRRFHVRHVPVAIRKELLGIVSDRDVRRALGWSSVRDLQADATARVAVARMPMNAAEIMQGNVETIAPSSTLGESVRRMLDRRIHSLPVIERDELVGMITQTDFVRAIASAPLL